jgi:SAM-dependent methyltransferase
MDTVKRPFQGTVADYRKYRLDYPQRLLDRLVALAGLEPGDPVLDLGCGPGNLALPFARAGMAVTAMDPEPEMLQAAGAAAQGEALSIRFVQGGSADLKQTDGPFRLVLIGRAFHWMDRAATLAMLDRIVAPGGGVALLHDAHPPVAENGWYKVAVRANERYVRTLGPTGRDGGGHRRYEPFLFASAFTRLDGLSVTVRTPISEDEIVGRAFSIGTCSRAILEGAAEAFETELRAGLRELSPDGNFMEIAEMVALLARRPE